MSPFLCPETSHMPGFPRALIQCMCLVLGLTWVPSGGGWRHGKGPGLASLCQPCQGHLSSSQGQQSLVGALGRSWRYFTEHDNKYLRRGEAGCRTSNKYVNFAAHTYKNAVLTDGGVLKEERIFQELKCHGGRFKPRRHLGLCMRKGPYLSLSHAHTQHKCNQNGSV